MPKRTPPNAPLEGTDGCPPTCQNINIVSHDRYPHAALSPFSILPDDRRRPLRSREAMAAELELCSILCHMELHGLVLFCLMYFCSPLRRRGPALPPFWPSVSWAGATMGLAAFIAGYVVGDLIWFTLAASGMAMLAKSAHTLFLCIRYAGAVYLLYLAYRLWTAPDQAIRDGDVPPQESRTRLFFRVSR